MSIEVLLFAAAREAAGTDRVELEGQDGGTVRDLLQELATRIPALAPVLPSCRAAVNESFARPDTPVATGSVVAILPPVSGG